jgi:hypothetical protein
MRKTHLLAAVLGACPVIGLAAVTAPAMAAPAAAGATARPAAPGNVRALQKMLSPDYNFSCPVSYRIPNTLNDVVNATGIHIWSNDATHNPKLLYSIAKGHHFESSWVVAPNDNVGCQSPLESGNGPAQHWILGWDTSDTSHTGWVGLKYLNS